VVGSGGREHALVHSLAKSKAELFAAPGNPGTSKLATSVDLAATDVGAITAWARREKIDLVVVGPEAPLWLGLADALRAEGIAVLGPNRGAAKLEASKAFAKEVMDRARVPTARWRSFEEAAPAIAYARELGGAVAVKADGLAAGKGVVVASLASEAEEAIQSMLGGALGEAGRRVVIEERLEGEELSVLALTDGVHVALLAPAQDHKRVGEGDQGPNTGGMGAYSPAPRATPELLARVEATAIRPVLEVLAKAGTPFSGVLYAGLMLTPQGPKVLEYNVRFGDPETEAILPRLAEDALDLFAAAASGDLEDRPVRFNDDSAVTVVLAAEGYPGPPKTGALIEGLRAAESEPGVLVFHAGTKPGAGGEITVSGGRVLAVTGLGSDLAGAVDAAYRGVGRIHWPGMHYRRDIARRALEGG
jgi:phosphoribosylamine--glycine ligase